MEQKENQKKLLSQKFLVVLSVPVLFLSLAFVPQLRKALKMVFAGSPQIEHRLYILSDGTATWDDSSWDMVINSPSQGKDSNPKNLLVRAQDTITYAIEQSINLSDAKNVVSTAVLSTGQRWLDLPQQCKQNGVTPVSSITPDGRTLVCNTGDHTKGSEILIPAVAVVSTAQNNDDVWVTSRVQSDEVSLSQPLESDKVKVTALFGIDVENEIYIPDVSKGRYPSADLSTVGQLVTNTVTVRLKMGSELPLGNSQNFTFSLNYTNYAGGTPAQGWLMYDWSTLPSCELLDGGLGGSITCIKSGNDVTVSLNNLNYALSKNPVNSLYSFKIRTWIPTDDAQHANASHTLAYRTNIQFAPVPASVSGIQSNVTGVETNINNNVQDAQHLWTPVGVHCSYTTTDENGCGGDKNGTGTTFPGLTWSIGMPWALRSAYTDRRSSPFLNKQRVHCLKVDKRYFDYITFNTVSEFQYIPSLHKNEFSNNQILEYSTTPITLTDSALQNQKCDNSMTWTSTKPLDESTITALRIRITPNITLSNADAYWVSATYNYKIRDNINPLPVQGTKIPVYAHAATMTSDWSSYDPSQSSQYASDMDLQFSNPDNAQYGSNNFNIARLNFVLAQMSISKSLSSPSVTTVAPNDTISYTITPTVFGSQTPVDGTTFTIEDEIPSDKNGAPVATYVENSMTVSGSNGTYNGPVLQNCTVNPVKSCLVWTLTNVVANQPLASLTYSLKAGTDLSNLPELNSVYTFSNIAHILSSNPTINNASDMDNTQAGVQYPKSEVTLNLRVHGGYSIGKSLSTSALIDKRIYPVNNPDHPDNYPVFVLKYKNNRNLDLSNVAIIDILPYNGDDTVSNRSNTFEPASTTASKFTDISEKGFPGLSAKPIIPPGASIEYVIYDPANSATYPKNIKQDPCHVSNIKANLDPGSNTPEAAGHYCRLLRINGEHLPTDGVTGADGTKGTGVTPWTNVEPVDFGKVVAFRVITPIMPMGAEKEIIYRIRPQGNKSGDIYCNTFGSRNFEISLDVRSNSVCAKVEGIDLELEKSVDGNSDGVYGKAEGINVGRNYTYKIEMKNTSAMDATNVVVEENIPTGITVISAVLDDSSDSNVHIDPTAGKVLWNLNSVKTGAKRVLVIEALLKEEDLNIFKDNLIRDNYVRNLVEIKSVDQKDMDSQAGNISNPFDPSNSEDDESRADVYLPLSIGDTVWYDQNADGRQNTKEQGISGVTVALFRDSNSNGNLDPSTDEEVGRVVTDHDGKYLFSNLPTGNYFVAIPLEQFNSGKLMGYKITANRTIDPNDNIDEVNDGVLLEQYITTSKAMILTYGGEPEGDGFQNRTVDFGFYYSEEAELPNTGASKLLSLISVVLTLIGSAIISFSVSKRNFYKRD